MEIEISPRHSPGSAVHLLSPNHAHRSPIDGYASIQQIRRSLSRSPSKPARYPLHTKAASSSPTAPPSSGLSRSCSADGTVDLSPKLRYSVKRAGVPRTASRRTSPNSPIRHALKDNTNQANASPCISRRSSSDGDQENMDCTPDSEKATQGAGVDAIGKPDFLRPDRLFKPVKQEHASPMKSSPLKRSDGVMNLDAASFGSPRNKRRSLHSPSLGIDFNIFDQGLDGTHSDSASSSEEKDTRHDSATSAACVLPSPKSPQRRQSSLRKSTLQQRAGPGRSRHTPEVARESILSPSLMRARSRISLDSALPLRIFDVDSPFRRSSVNDPPVLFPPPGQKLYQSAPKPHPLSHALTPSSSTSSVADEPSQHSQASAAPSSLNTDVAKQPSTFSQSLPIGVMRPSYEHESSQGSSQDSFATPDGYKMAKPLPQAFMSTGLISKRNRNMDMPPANFLESVNMPDTPSKKAHVHIASSPAPSSALGKVHQPMHEFGSPTTPFNGRTSKISPESFGKNANIFGSRVGAPQLTRRGSFLSIDGEDVNNSPTQQLESQSSNDDLPPTPTKSSTLR